MANSNGLRITDGSTSFEGGIDSGRVPTIEGPQNPTGLKRNQLSFASNCTMRGGGVLQRTGWLRRVQDFSGDDGLFQGASFFIPDNDVPKLVASIGGRILQFDVWNNNAVTDITQGLNNPSTLTRSYFCQAEDRLIIQAGDFITNPLIWDGTTMRRSNGILPPTAGTPGVTHVLNMGAWTVAAIGATSLAITLAAPYPGAIGDVGQLGVLGTFEVFNVVANTIFLTTIASPYVGFAIAASPAVNFVIAPIQGEPNLNSEVPAGKAMDYFMGRLWVQISNKTYTAGDIAYVGEVPYNRYSFLNFTENTYLAGGGSFNVPDNAGAIRSIFHTSAIDTALGEGQLIIATRDAIYTLTVPVTRTDWNLIDNNNQPIQRVIQTNYGTVSDRAVVKSNGDIFYSAFDGIRSLEMAVRYYHQWGQVPISRNENRVLQFNDKALASFASGIEFDNRLLMTVLPKQTPVGVVHQGIIPLDFDLITSLASREPPAWEGMYQGLEILQLVEAKSGGLQRAFAFIRSVETGRIQIWELTNYSKTEDVDNRVTWYLETPAYTWGSMFTLKELDSLELWLDKIYGTVDILVDYRQDQSPCWINWHLFQICSARSTCEDVANPVCYPEIGYREGYRSTIVLPKPPFQCDEANARPSNIGYQFQVRLTIKGWCRVRGILVHALPRDKQPYLGIVC